MSNDFAPIVNFSKNFLQRNSPRKSGLTEAEKLVIDVILQNMTYRQASIAHKYTESSLQNAASGLFKVLSKVVGVPVNRQNFLELLEKEWLESKAESVDSEIVFDRLQASLWIRQNRAALVSISYGANQEWDLTSYLIEYSPSFEATFCLEVSRNSSVLELLWNLCHVLQAALPVPRNDQAALLKLIGLALKQRSTLLLLRFDRQAHLKEDWEIFGKGGRSASGSERHNFSEYAEVLASLGLMESNSCILALDNDSVSNELELKRSLAYQLQLMVNKLVGKLKMEAPRLILIENDVKIVCNILQTYLQKRA
jgi:hypothetical protein